MKQFVKAIPSNTNVAGSGDPFADVVKMTEAITEIRGSVPNRASDLGSAELTDYVTLLALVVNLERSATSFL